MRRYKTSPTEPKFFDNYNMEAAAEMIAALKRTPREQRLETLAVVMKLFIEGYVW